MSWQLVFNSIIVVLEYARLISGRCGPFLNEVICQGAFR